MTCPRPARIVSGGQTGVDRAALDAAVDLGIPAGGWCPRDRLAEDGPIAAAYPLTETPSRDYAERTEWNVRDSDGTLILTLGEPSGGTAYTIAMTKKHGRPCHIVDLADGSGGGDTAEWMRAHAIAVLNVAGPRASGGGEAYRLAYAYLTACFAGAD